MTADYHDEVQGGRAMPDPLVPLFDALSSLGRPDAVRIHQHLDTSLRTECPYWCGVQHRDPGEELEVDRTHLMTLGKTPNDGEIDIYQRVVSDGIPVIEPVMVSLDFVDADLHGITGEQAIALGELIGRAGQHAIRLTAESRS